MKKKHHEANRRNRNDPATTTTPERLFENFLKAMGIKYIKEKEFFCGSKQYFLDFFLTRERMGVEVDGKHHSSTKVRKMDKRKARMLLKYHGIDIVHIKNSEVECGDFRKITEPKILKYEK